MVALFHIKTTTETVTSSRINGRKSLILEFQLLTSAQFRRPPRISSLNFAASLMHSMNRADESATYIPSTILVASSTSGNLVDTIGNPAAAYSYIFTGFVALVRSFTMNGIIATFHERTMPGRFVYGTSPNNSIFLCAINRVRISL